MPSLYNCRHDGDHYRITKFDADWNVEASYLCTETECDCPAGHRPSCRHRQMLPKFLHRGYVGTEFFFDYDRGGWVQGASKEVEDNLSKSNEELIAQAMPLEPSLINHIYAEEDCPGHVASETDPKVCGLYGVHIDSLRPDDEPSPDLTFEEEDDTIDELEIAEMADGIERDNALEPSLAPAGLGQAKTNTALDVALDTIMQPSFGLGQASEPRPSPISTSEIMSLPQYNDVPIREVETLEPSTSSPLPLEPHSQTVTTTDFESVGDGSSPSVAAKETIRRRV